MLNRAYILRQPINLFISTADQLFGPITTIRRHGRVVKHILWTAFTLKEADWERPNETHVIISDANNIQQYFSADKHPTLWRAIPVLEELQTAWEAKHADSQYELYKPAVQAGLDKISKYYQKLDEKSVYILALVLHPYYKFAYIKMAWGGPEEQERERAAGNPNAKDWHDEALKTVEKTMAEYWKERRRDVPRPRTTLAPARATSSAKANTLESDFDRHRRQLVEQATLEQDAGWAAELRRYIKDMPEDVSKETDIVEWWSV
ncbi:hypothetical protein BJ138DRAFT_1020984 [Hygrophoropsis aurantiaca]|uniref:Uncharacterized protein n=1 Tax=Hygrophoropsis aurantiaca TaxID=72124 RepID=A0ACB7ZQ68_9AGAM|nr:hypothetical protein BJ138DRAFT_1020984 [Hygrophoropsis aurantiaca]